jgi:CHAT domain-containing protein
MRRNIIFFSCFGMFIQMVCFFNKTFPQNIPITEQRQEPTVNIAEEEFNKAIKRHRDELESLINRKTNQPLDVFYSQSQSFAKVSAQSITTILHDAYPDSTALLFYNYEDTTLKIWLLNQQGVKAYHKQEIQQEKIEEVINELRNALGIDLLQNSRAPRRRGVEVVIPQELKKIDLSDAISNLTDILLPASVGTQLTSVKALIIVPVLSLGTVPFAILKPFNSKEFLIEKMSISIAPSLFDIGQEKSEKWSSVFIKPLIVGNPNPTNQTRWSIPPLAGAEKEAKSISKLINASSSPLIGNQATRAAVMAVVEDADFLYFATHGISDNKDSRTNSFLVLTEIEGDTGFWTMEEILKKHYKARLAVLSACQTGLGETYKGGVMALGRTFQVAGVPRVVMSLWKVDDNATADLMQAFVQNLQINVPSEALRQAMLQTKKNILIHLNGLRLCFLGHQNKRQGIRDFTL